MKSQNDIARILIFAIGAAIITIMFLLLTGCKCPCNLISQSGTHDHQQDSVRKEYVHDSIYIDRLRTVYTRGDTVYVHDSIWRDRWHKKLITDSVYINNTDTIYKTIEVEKKGAAFWKGSGIAFWILIALLVIGAAIGIAIKIIKK